MDNVDSVVLCKAMNAYYFYSSDRADKRRDYACYWPTYKKIRMGWWQP